MSKFIIRNLAVLSYVRGFTLWHYTAPGDASALDEACQPGFFADASDMLIPGDVILITNPCGAREIVALADGGMAELRRTA